MTPAKVILGIWLRIIIVLAAFWWAMLKGLEWVFGGNV